MIHYITIDKYGYTPAVSDEVAIECVCSDFGPGADIREIAVHNPDEVSFLTGNRFGCASLTKKGFNDEGDRYKN